MPPAFEAAVAAPGTSAGDAALPLLVNALVSAEQEHVLVLDDYHLISEPAIHDGVRFLLAAPARCVASGDRDAERAAGRRLAAARARRAGGDRERPAALQRRRGRGAAQRHARRSRFRRSSSSSLSARTEGWAAGLYLAGLSLRDGPAAPRRRPRLRPPPGRLPRRRGRCRRRSREARRFLRRHVRARPLLRGAVRRRARRGRVEAPARPRSSERTCSSSRSTSAASGFATTTSSARCCGASSRRALLGGVHRRAACAAPATGLPRAGDVSGAVAHLLAAGQRGSRRRT